MFEILGEEFSLFYTLLLVGLVVAAYFYLFRPPPPPPPIKVKPVEIKPVVKPPPKQEVIPADTKGRVKILFGTQTGTAEDFSRTLAREAKKFHIYAQLVDMELYDTALLPSEPYLIIVTSTHGEGEPPDTAKAFYKHLNALEPNYLEKVNYTVFGLGNKTYEQYNAVGRYMDKQMETAGAKKFFERGEGDDDCSLEEDFNKWKKRLWPALCKKMGLDTAADASVEDEKFVPRFKIVNCPPAAAGKFTIRGGAKKTNDDGTPVYDIKNPYFATVAANRELHTEASDRSCRHIEFEIGNHLAYKAGDHLGVFPENSKFLVEQFAERLKADLDQVIALVPTESSLPANLSTDTELNTAATESALGPCTLRQILTDGIDLTTPPRKAVLRALAEYATDPKDKAELQLLGKDGDAHDKYSQWIKQDQRTVFEVLQHFPSVSPPLFVILELLPRLAARFYSISSSPSAHPGSVHITSVVVRFNTPTGREHAGVCSTWMADLAPGMRVPVFIRESSFKLPSDPAPILMVGPGTGLAPFRAFLQEIGHKKHANNESGWATTLFFGCRNRQHDYIYEQELVKFVDDKTLDNLYVAFSREQNHKVYVQDKLEEEETRKVVWEALNDKKGYFYVCGDARLMAKAVHHALVKMAMECGSMTEEKANTYVENLQKSGHYLQDVWF